MAIAPSKLGKFVLLEGFSWPTSKSASPENYKASDDTFVRRLRGTGLVHSDDAEVTERFKPHPASNGFISGMASTSLNRIIVDGKGGAKPAERWDVGKRTRDVEQGPDGSLWMLEEANPGALIHVTPK